MKQLYAPFNKNNAIIPTKRKLFCQNHYLQSRHYSLLALHVHHVSEAFLEANRILQVSAR